MKKSIIQFAALIFILTPISNSVGESMFHSGKKKNKSEIDRHSGKDLNSYYSDKELGAIIKEGKTIFRLFTPNAIKVVLCTFKNPEDEKGSEYEMTRDKDAVWETELEGELTGLYYGYKVFHDGDTKSKEENALCVDPYAKAVTTFNTYFNPRNQLFMQEQF
jgi:pullulanase